MSGRVLVVCGPTATGKTALSLALAEMLDGEIVSADSMQIYRGMDIGTAKATAAERARVPLHTLDVAEPWENYSVARYVEEASRCCDEILARGKLPIVTGGTGLYIDSLLAGRDFSGELGGGALRQALNDDYDRLGGEAMLARLCEVDPDRAAKLHPGDKRRIVRALEVFEATGTTITEHDERTRRLPPRYEARRIALSYADRDALYARIDRRVDDMADAGLFDEVAALLAAGLSPESTAMQAIGYKEAVLALRGELSRSDALALIKQASRRYAKRQLTWFRRTPETHWILWEGAPDVGRAAEDIRNSDFGIRN